MRPGRLLVSIGHVWQSCFSPARRHRPGPSGQMDPVFGHVFTVPGQRLPTALLVPGHPVTPPASAMPLGHYGQWRATRQGVADCFRAHVVAAGFLAQPGKAVAARSYRLGRSVMRMGRSVMAAAGAGPGQTHCGPDSRNPPGGQAQSSLGRFPACSAEWPALNKGVFHTGVARRLRQGEGARLPVVSLAAAGSCNGCRRRRRRCRRCSAG